MFHRKRRIWPWLLLGAGVITVGAAALGAAVEAEIDRAREELFEVGPNCSYIHFKGGGAGISEEEAKRSLAVADSWLFDPMIRQAAKEGLRDSQQVAIRILDAIFPECAGQWPPASMLDVSKQLVWFATWSHVEARMKEIL